MTDFNTETLGPGINLGPLVANPNGTVTHDPGASATPPTHSLGRYFGGDLQPSGYGGPNYGSYDGGPGYQLPGYGGYPAGGYRFPGYGGYGYDNPVPGGGGYGSPGGYYGGGGYSPYQSYPGFGGFGGYYGGYGGGQGPYSGYGGGQGFYSGYGGGPGSYSGYAPQPWYGGGDYAWALGGQQMDLGQSGPQGRTGPEVSFSETQPNGASDQLDAYRNADTSPTTPGTESLSGTSTTPPGQGQQPAQPQDDGMSPLERAYQPYWLAPNKINGRNWNRMNRSTQQFALGGYESAGYDPNDVEDTIKQGLPKYATSRYGMVE